MSWFTRVTAWVCDRWEAAQVELHGHYSVEHLQEFEQYHANTSWLRVVSVCLLTPLPCIMLVRLLDLLPLEPLENGPQRSPHFWIRSSVTIFLLDASTLGQFRHHLPQLKLQRWQIAVIGIVSIVASMPFNYQMTLSVGYPMPFMMVVGTGPWTVSILATLYVLKRKQIHKVDGLVTSGAWYFLLCVCQITMTVVYPLFNYLYKSLTSLQQTGAVLLLPVIKLLAKNWISSALPDLDDAKPEAVVFNIEIFHALFVALCMGNTTSTRTIMALMAIDLFQAWMSFLDILGILHDLKPLVQKLQATRAVAEDTKEASIHHSLMVTASRIVQSEPFQARSRAKSKVYKSTSKRWSMAVSQLAGVTDSVVQTVLNGSIAAPLRGLRSKSTIHPVVLGGERVTGDEVKPRCTIQPASEEAQLSTDLTSINVVERGVLVGQTQKLLFVTEFVVLIEYVEVIMPMLYSLCVVALTFSHNLRFYVFLDGISSVADLVPIVSNVMLYASLEFVSLVLITIIVWRKLRISLLHQLAFVLEQRFANIQAKLFLWVLNIMQNSLVHVGADYSLRFAWLHKSGRD